MTMTHLKPGRRGQALLLITFALFAMCGLLGLAVDLGWGYFVKKSAQASADAGAMAAAYQAMKLIGPAAPIACDSGGVKCQASPAACDLTGNLLNACQYAEQSGFVASQVKVAAGTGTPLTGQPVSADYWVTVRTVQTIPQLFSAVLGNPTGISSARSTAVVIPVLLNGSLIALNRHGDSTPGYNVDLRGNGTLVLPNGLYAADNNGGIQTNGSTSIQAPIFEMSPAGTKPSACVAGTCTFTVQSDGPQFLDPMRGLGQPPLPASALNTYAVMSGGTLNGNIYKVDSTNHVVGAAVSLGGSTVTLGPGNYFPATCNSPCTLTAPISTGSISTGGGTVNFSGATFGDYFFYGGLSIGGTVNMGPGRYVVVGGLNDTGVIQTANPGTDGGQIIIVTGSSSNTLSGTWPNLTNNSNNNLYPGLITQLNSTSALAQMGDAGGLAFAQTTLFKSADGTGDPTGIDPTHGSVPASLDPFTGVVFWQDQANSLIKYTSSGNVDTSCGSMNSPCTTSYSTSPNIDFHAQGDASLNGIFYQPRGAGITSIGHGNSGDITGHLQVITGFFHSNGGGGMILSDPSVPFKRRIVALVE
jgi:Flp pilus assembly protein TadG